MNPRLSLLALLAAGALVLTHGVPTPAQLDPSATVDFEAAARARQTSAEFAQRMAAYQQAAQAHQDAIASYDENGTFSSAPNATGLDAIAQGTGTSASGEKATDGGGPRLGSALKITKSLN